MVTAFSQSLLSFRFTFSNILVYFSKILCILSFSPSLSQKEISFKLTPQGQINLELNQFENFIAPPGDLELVGKMTDVNLDLYHAKFLL